MSNFENPGLDLKKRNIITSSASALPILRRGCDHYALGRGNSCARMLTIMVWVADVGVWMGMDGYGWVWMGMDV
jgi:hypothetical protein